MGRVQVTARLENLEDVYKNAQGALSAEQVRGVDVTDALIDTGATGLLVPRQLIAQLGLSVLRTRSARTIAGSVEVPMYRAVRLTVQGATASATWERSPMASPLSSARCRWS